MTHGVIRETYGTESAISLIPLRNLFTCVSIPDTTSVDSKHSSHIQSGSSEISAAVSEDVSEMASPSVKSAVIRALNEDAAFFSSELKELQMMGFTQSTQSLLLLLQHYRGSVESVVTQLLDQPMCQDD